jgi:hypothetical protein
VSNDCSARPRGHSERIAPPLESQFALLHMARQASGMRQICTWGLMSGKKRASGTTATHLPSQRADFRRAGASKKYVQMDEVSGFHVTERK